MSCHNYTFFDIEPGVRTLSSSQLKRFKSEFIKIVKQSKDVQAFTYKSIGFRRDSRFALHLQSKEAYLIQEFIRRLLCSKLGGHLKVAYTLTGLVRPTQYNPKQTHKETKFKDGEKKYLIVYPFTKTLEWHLLPFEERREMMKEHVMTAHKFSDRISQLLLYAYGIDDHEFIVSYMTDSLLDFQSLVMELRGTRGRLYTKSDLPIFVCTSSSIEEALETI